MSEDKNKGLYKKCVHCKAILLLRATYCYNCKNNNTDNIQIESTDSKVNKLIDDLKLLKLDIIDIKAKLDSKSEIKSDKIEAKIISKPEIKLESKIESKPIPIVAKKAINTK